MPVKIYEIIIIIIIIMETLVKLHLWHKKQIYPSRNLKLVDGTILAFSQDIN